MSNDQPSPDDDPMAAPLGAGIDFTDPNSRLAPLYARVTGVLAVLLIGAAFALYSAMPLMHTDVWTHLAHGRWVVEHRQLPEHEPLSPFTDKTTPMYHQAWLSQVLYQGLYSWGQALYPDDRGKRFAASGELLRQAHVFSATAMLAALWVAFRRSADSGALALLGVALVVVGGVVSLGLFRPQVFGQMLFAVFLAMISRPKFSKAAVVAAPLLLVLWANLHGSYVLGFVLLGLAWLGRGVETKRGAVADPCLRRLTLAILLGLVGVAVLNPAGPGIYLRVLSFGGNPNLKTLLEWQPITVPANRPSLVVFAILWVGIVAAQLLARKWLRPVHYLAAALFGLAPLFQQRLGTWWLLVGVWVFVSAVSLVAGRWNLVLPQSVPSLRKTVLAVLAAVPFLFISPLSGWVTSGDPPPLNRVYVAATPVELSAALADPTLNYGDRIKPFTDTLKEQYADRPIGPVLCSAELGEFLLWRAIDGCPPVRFTHAHLFPPDHWAACEAAERGDDWEAFADQLGVNVIAVEPASHPKLVSEVTASDRWRVVIHEKGGRDPRALLFVAVRVVPAPPPR